MQTARIVQAVALMLIVALAASCAASKQYTSKLFAPRNGVAAADSHAVALRFLDLDQVEPDRDNWVSTDLIMGRDTTGSTAALDKLAGVFPAAGTLPVKKDTVIVVKDEKTVLASAEIKKAQPVEEPIVKTGTQGGVRMKTTREK